MTDDDMLTNIELTELVAQLRADNNNNYKRAADIVEATIKPRRINYLTQPPLVWCSVPQNGGLDYNYLWRALRNF